ncbi:chemotaxis protein CheW [Paludibaculum fermentans]|uniref:Chemotaxis protein CheW n=1 Tax=Paludibaculum fermentans TaxID=1473598 RepID=A0A7S7NN70_PALFE|nr:chemotaxis protein CheW [Paludibaculum fermentans]QOY86727.1 chemotaxis protein CheW [Paludibaculum fermentans]
MQNDTLPASGGLKDESQLVTFLLNDEEFGFDIMSVQEIIRPPKLAKVPRTPPYVDGIANLRGVVLPVIDMRTRFGMERAPQTDRTRVLVVDINGVKTGLQVDRVKQVTSVLRSEMEPPPAAIRGTTADYLEGVVKLDKGQRIVMALNAAHVCEIGVTATTASSNKLAAREKLAGAGSTGPLTGADAKVQKVVTFRLAKEEFAFHMEHVREILRVQTPKQVPDVPGYVLGVLTVRGQILPVIDLRRLLHQRPLADEFADSCRQLREDYECWIDRASKLFAGGTQSKLEASVTEQFRKWQSETNSSSQLLMESLAQARGLNEKVIKQLQMRARHEECGDRDAAAACAGEALSAGRETLAALRQFEQQVAQNIQEDQRIIVVDAEGLALGLVVDHVHEVLNVPKNLMEPPPRVKSSGGMELSGVARLDEGSRLIMMLDVGNLMKDQTLRAVQDSSLHADEAALAGEVCSTGAGSQDLSEVQLVTFMLGPEEYGIPISQIQEIDRLSRITKVPKAAEFIEGITNLRGEVIPVLDTRKRFDLEVRPADDRTRIIIVDLGGVKTGLVVDSVREVLNLARKDIALPPDSIGSGIDQQFISGIGKVDAGKRMIVVLDVERILSRQEQAQLSETAN